jgi:AraC-like DNA-binding protein
MQRLVLSTDDFPEEDRFSYWREEVCEGVIGVSGERGKGQETPFSAHLRASFGASLVRIRYRSDGHPIFRRPHDIARIGWDDHIFLYCEVGAGGWLDVGGREFVTQRGDLMLGDPTIPFAIKARVKYDIDLWRFPRKLIDPHRPISQGPSTLLLAGHDGLNGMVKAYLNAFARQIDALDDREADCIADNFCRLLAVACAAAAGDQREATHLARLEEAKRYINRRLADPALTPGKAAAALKISVRQLHRLFEPSGTSFAQYVLRRRLEECRAALANPIGDRSITDIALAWGFNSLPTFYRSFRRVFEATPSELRAPAGQSTWSTIPSPRAGGKVKTGAARVP